MFFKYLGRELTKRKKQTALISSGLAIAIALVVVVNSVSMGIKTAQAEALSGLYGIGTDISVSKVTKPGSNSQKFDVGAGAGTSTGTKRTFSRSRLEVNRDSGTLAENEVTAIGKVSGVTASVATLKLTSVTFNGELPKFQQGSSGNNRQPGQNQGGQGSTPTTRPTGGSDGAGGAAFSITSFTVEGVSLESEKVGPLASIKVTSGRAFSATDSGQPVAVIDSNYASSQKLTVGKTITLASKSFKIVGIVASTSTVATTPSNVYIPLDIAQSLSSNAGVYSNVYVAAKSATNLSDVKKEIEKAAPDATVSTSADLASTVTGSLATASSLVSNMGGWLIAIVLLAAFLTSILFTMSGVNRRIREFGTLKAIGWRSHRVVGQVVGESLINGFLGGLIGIGIGVGGVWLINNWAPALSASVASARTGMFGGPGGGPGRSQTAAAAVNLALHASVDLNVIWLAIGFAMLGGLLAGAFGGLRAAKLSPATALRSFE